MKINFVSSYATEGYHSTLLNHIVLDSQQRNLSYINAAVNIVKNLNIS